MAGTTTIGGHSPITVIFSEANNQQHHLQCCKLAAAAFGAPLSEQDYLEREEYLDQQPLTQHGGWRTWCLRTTTEPPGQVVSACKTIQRSLLVSEAGTVGERKGYCIASVVTHPDFRGRGLASALLEHLARWLDGPGDAYASMLYTSIGNFYHGRGWIMLPAYQLVLSTLPTPELCSPSDQTLPMTRLLEETEISELCLRDVESIKCSFQSSQENKDDRHISVLPTPDITTWMQDRGDFTTSKVVGRIPLYHGSICESADTWLYWYHDHRKKHLAVQRIHLGAPSYSQPQLTQALTAILFDAVKEARNWNLPKVVVWDPSAATLEAASTLGKTHGIEVDHGERVGSSIPSIRWRDADLPRKIIVHNNEKFAYS
ncbi:hypothetical protein PG993_004566 [Apiospora rasikravindrae]|uniref:N-acetyltransferase domain-containing protein n=1 Tax=Apiospora rasikravindrae TaxID=990691 RepID=A0ABR1TDP8_9PEZI